MVPAAAQRLRDRAAKSIGAAIVPHRDDSVVGKGFAWHGNRFNSATTGPSSALVATRSRMRYLLKSQRPQSSHSPLSSHEQLRTSISAFQRRRLARWRGGTCRRFVESFRSRWPRQPFSDSSCRSAMHRRRARCGMQRSGGQRPAARRDADHPFAWAGCAADGTQAAGYERQRAAAEAGSADFFAAQGDTPAAGASAGRGDAGASGTGRGRAAVSERQPGSPGGRPGAAALRRPASQARRRHSSNS